MTLKSKILSSIKWNSITTLITAIGGILQLYILVKFIDEKDFGLMAIVNVVLAFAIMFLDVGINNGIIYKQKITNSQLSSLYWLTVLVGFILGLLVFLLSPILSIFYQETLLTPISQIVAFVFLIRAFGQQYRVILKKNLHFDSLSKIDLCSFFVSFTVVVVLATQGFGIYALVIALLVKYSVDSILSIGFGRHFFRPQWKMNLQEIHFFIRFGSFQMGERFANFFNSQFDTIIIGKILGMEVLGVYDVLKRFLVRPFGIINGLISEISFPVMAKMQGNEEQLKDIYLRIMNYVGSLNFPIYIFVFFQAALVIRLMFGKDWLIYQSVFEMLCLYVLIYSTGNPIGSLILAKGRVELGFYWTIGVVFINVPIIWWSTHWGLVGLVTALVALQLILASFTYLFLVKRLIPVHVGAYLGSLFPPLMISFLIGIATSVLDINLPTFMQLSIVTLLYFTLYVVVSWQFNSVFFKTFLDVIKAKI